MSEKPPVVIIGVLASIATIIGTCIATVALIPAFGEWLNPRDPATPINTSSPTAYATLASFTPTIEILPTITLSPADTALPLLITPEPTSLSVILPGQDFTSGCIDSQFWRHREQTNTPKDNQGCWLLSRFGLVADNGLKINYANELTYWLMTPIDRSYTEIRFKVLINSIAPVKPGGKNAFLVFGIGGADYNVFSNGYFLFYRRDEYNQSQKAVVIYGDSPSNTTLLTNYAYGTIQEVSITVVETQMHLKVHDMTTKEIWEEDFIMSPATQEVFWIGYNISNGSGSSISALISELTINTMAEKP